MWMGKDSTPARPHWREISHSHSTSPSGFYFWTQTESEEANFAITGMKFYSGTEGQCKSARDILEAKNVALKNANPTGQISKAITMRYPDGQPMRLLDGSGKLRKEFIKLPFLLFGTSPRCTHGLSCAYDYVSTWYTGSHTRLPHSHSSLLPPPSLRYNNTAAHRMHSIARLTPKGTAPPPPFYSPGSLGSPCIKKE